MSAATQPVVPLTTLKQVLCTILDHIIHDLRIDSVPIDPEKDFYWDVESKDLYDTGNKNPGLEIGRLRDDWEFLSKIAEDREQGVALMLIHAAPLLRHIGERIGQ
jgi:hypothetical protein